MLGCCSITDVMSLRTEKIKEVAGKIREARRYWDAHRNKAARRERELALGLYSELTEVEKKEIPEQLRVWLRYRSEKYFGEERTSPGQRGSQSKKLAKTKKKAHAPRHSIASRRINSPVGSLVLLSSRKGISGLYFGDRIERSTLPEGNEKDRFLNQAEEELGEYFRGERTSFEVSLDPKGSEFQRDAWRQLSPIPYGETISYGEQARRMGDFKAVRAVGTANGANPISIIIPCHRVIGKNGTLTGFGGGLGRKEKLLRLEGVLLDFFE